MSYSRRQLYAFGETFGDSATRMEAGGRIVYGGGGGGGKKPVEPTTQITESEPEVTNRTTTNEIPEYLTNASQDLIARGQALTSRPYEAYTGARVAEFSPLMNQAFTRMGGQQVAGQIGEATGLASLAGQRAMDYGQFQQGVQQYMNPYMQNVVDIERRKAQEAADQQAAMLSGQAAKMGAFGGSGAALQQRALRRDTAQQLADLQAQGLDRAYQSAVGQYNQGISSGLAAAGQLAGLGSTQFGQEMDITKGLGTAGDVQRQREQALLDVKYGDYLTAQRYPYEQLAFQQSLISGVPYSTTQRTNEVSQPGKSVTQRVTTTEAAAAAGGEVRGYAGGGITSLLSDQQINQRQQMPNISDLARMALQAEEVDRARLRAAQQAMMAQQPQGTVADEELSRIASLEAGIGGLEVPDDLVGDTSMAGGGIVAFYEGDEVPEPDDSFGMPYGIATGRGGLPFQDPRLTQSGIAQSVAALAANQKAAEGGQEDRKRPDGAPRSYAGILDQIYGPQEAMLREASAKEMAAQQAYKDALGEDVKESEAFASKARQRIEQQIAGLEGADKSALESSVLDFGLRLLATKGEKNMAKALAGAGLDTLAGHKQALKELAAKRDKYEEALRQVDEFAYGEKKGTRKDQRAATLALGKADAALSSSLGELFGDRAKDMLQLYRDNQSRAHAEKMAKSRGTSSGLGADRLELNALNSLRISAMAKLAAAQRGFDNDAIAKAEKALAQVENDIRALIRNQTGGVAGGKVTGSSTLPPGFKLD